MKSGRDRIEQIRDGQQRAAHERRRLLERMKGSLAAQVQEREAAAQALKAKNEKFKFIEIERTLAAASRLRFWDLEPSLTADGDLLNRPTLELLTSFLTVLRRDSSSSVLQWPYGQRDLTLLHPIAMLAVLSTSPQSRTGDYTWCPSVRDFRTLYYPWRGASTGSNLRDILVNRQDLIEFNKYHLTRSIVRQAEASPELECFHKTLGNLNTLKERDETRPHLAHPSLYELFPMFGALGGPEAPDPFKAAVNELFGRVAYGAGLTQLTDHRPHLTKPATAPFGLFGICPRANVKRALSQPCLADSDGKGRAPDICMLDLGSPGLARIGPAWEEDIAVLIDELDRSHPGTPILAVTSDIYVHRRIHQMLERRREPGFGETKSSIVVRSGEHPLKPDLAVGVVSAVKFAFHSTGGDGGDAIRAMSEAARGLADRSLAGKIRRKIGDLRRAMSLPCGLSAAYGFLERSEGQTAADDFLEHRSEAGIVVVLRQSAEECENDTDRKHIAAAEAAVTLAFKGFENETPIGSLVAELIGSLVGKSSRSLIAFATESDRRLGEFRITNDAVKGPAIRKRLDDGHMRVTTCQGIESVLEEIQETRFRNYWKRLILVSPSQEQLAVILGKQWLPEELIIVCDREFVARVASTYRPLSRHPDLAGSDRIGCRLAAAAGAAHSEAQARAVPSVDLELEAHRPPDRDESVIDLINSGDDDEDGAIVELALESGRTMRARPGTLIVRHHAEAEVNPFGKTLAREVKAGHTIVVPDVAFVTEARTVLPVKVLAQGWVKVYHALVEAALPALPGDTLAAKARHVHQLLGQSSARVVTHQSVCEWLKVTEHRKAADEVLRPHAAQRRRDFDAFTKILGIPPDMADKIWREGIEPLRIDRRRAGARMAQAFVSVLVDTHGSGGKLSPDVREKIDELRKRAREHLDGVVSARTYDAGTRATG